MAVQMKNNNFTVMHWMQVPTNTQLLPTVWQIRYKKDIKSNKIKLYKARLSIDRSRIKKVVHYNETYVPVAL